MKMRNLHIWMLVLLMFSGCKEKAPDAKTAHKASEPVPTIVSEADTARKALEQFCVYQFQGELGAGYSGDPEYLAKEHKIFGDFPPDIETGSIIIVSTYSIIQVVITGDSGYGRVVFERLGYGNGSELVQAPRRYVPDYSESDNVRYELKKNKGNWIVYNPPTPHVSIGSLVSFILEQKRLNPAAFVKIEKHGSMGMKVMAQSYAAMSIILKISSDYFRRMNVRYKDVDAAIKSDPSVAERVRVSYTGKWNIEILPETQLKPGK